MYLHPRLRIERFFNLSIFEEGVKPQVKRKLKKHDRPRHRYILVAGVDKMRALEVLKAVGINYKEIELRVKSLGERKGSKIIIKVDRDDIEKVKMVFEKAKIGTINVSGTLKGLLR